MSLHRDGWIDGCIFLRQNYHHHHRFTSLSCGKETAWPPLWPVTFIQLHVPSSFLSSFSCVFVIYSSTILISRPLRSTHHEAPHASQRHTELPLLCSIPLYYQLWRQLIQQSCYYKPLIFFHFAMNSNSVCNWMLSMSVESKTRFWYPMMAAVRKRTADSLRVGESEMLAKLTFPVWLGTVCFKGSYTGREHLVLQPALHSSIIQYPYMKAKTLHVYETTGTDAHPPPHLDCEADQKRERPVDNGLEA